MDLYEEITKLIAQLDVSVRQIRKSGTDLAEAEQKYRIALAQQILLERDKGTPVSIVSDICRGKPEVANLKMQRDIAESVHKAALEAVNVYKLQLKST